MKKIIVILFCAVTSGLIAQEHYVGAKVSLGPVNVTEIAIENKYMLGSSYGVTYEYFNNSRMILGAELLLTYRGFRNEITDIALSGEPFRILSIDNMFQYLTVPIKLGYVFNEESNFFAKIGVAPSIEVNTKIKRSNGFIRSSYSAANIEYETENFNLFTILEIGINIKSYENSSIYSTVGGFYGLNHAVRTGGISPNDSNHYGFEASVGYRLRI